MDEVVEGVRMLDGMSAPDAPPVDFDKLDEAQQGRRRSRWALIGFGLGVGAGFVFTAVEVAFVGFEIFCSLLVFNLILLPIGWSGVGSRLGRKKPITPRTWRLPQLQIRTLMWIVAYVAFLFGLGLSAERLSDSARRSTQKFIDSDLWAKTYRGISLKWEAEARRRRETVEQLRSGKIPDGLSPGQAESLRSSDDDPKATPEDRKDRRNSIAEGEERMRTLLERFAIENAELAEYHRRLAAKYDKARWRPWLSVEPDPPMSPTQ